MKKEFATYEIALKLKELGFNEECLGDYYIIPSDKIPNPNGEFLGLKYEDVSSYTKLVSAPLWQQVIDWFREKHKIRVCNLVNIYIEATFIIYHSTDVKVIDGNDFYKTREQAILQAVELCKKQ